MISIEKPGTPAEMVDHFVIRGRRDGFYEELEIFDDIKPGTPAEMVEHFGIKGMHWGIRKERGTSNRKPAKKISEKKEKRAKGHATGAIKTQKEIDQLKSKSSWVYNRELRIRELEKKRDRQLKAAKDIRAGKLTDHQKKVIIGASAVGVALAAYGAYRLWDTGVGHQILSRGKYKENASLIRRGMSPDEIMNSVVKPINPKYGSFGTKMNCRRATFAYEMRRRGYDVRATNTNSAFGQTHAGLLNAITEGSRLPTSQKGVNKRLLKELLHPEKGTTLSDAMSVTQWGKEKIGDQNFIGRTSTSKASLIFDTIAKHGDGARGEIGMGWKMGGGHSMAWENIRGVPHIFDTQTGIHYDVAKFGKEITENMQEVGITRLDNAVLNKNFIERWVRNVK